MSASPADNVRQGKLTQFLDNVVSGKKILGTVKEGERFIEAICAQSDPPSCVTKLISGSNGLTSVQACMRFKTDPVFLNGSATSLLRYLQAPALKAICEGDFLQQIILHVVDPPIFWNAFVWAYRESTLHSQAQQCFAWLLLELISLPTDKATRYYEVAHDQTIQTSLLNSSEVETSTIGQKIKHILLNLNSPSTFDESGPGGRHDNDSEDFRQISILPTAEELSSREEPFLRRAHEIEDADKEIRLAIHMDNQFRLLREDMMGEMREELQIALGLKKGRHRGMVINGLEVIDIHCGEKMPWGLKLQCLSDFPQLAKIKDDKRKKFLMDNNKILKHLSLVCLIIDGEIVAFPTVNRDEELLSKRPPIILLQFTGKASAVKTFVKWKTCQKGIKLVQIDTAVFSYEPVLQRLQDMKSVELKDELLCWEKGVPMKPPPSPPTHIIREIETGGPAHDLRPLLGITTGRKIVLDPAQTVSLLMGLKQRVSLIQGPPGTGKSFLGALIAKVLYDSGKSILVVTYTNHSLDQFLEDLQNIGIPASSMVRLGRAPPHMSTLALSEQKGGTRLNRDSYKIIDTLKAEMDRLKTRLGEAFNRYKTATIDKDQLMEYLEFSDEDSDFYEAFSIPEAQDGMSRVGRGGRKIDQHYLINQWLYGKDAGMFKYNVNETTGKVWQMSDAARQAAHQKWKLELLKEQSEELAAIAEQYNETQEKLGKMFKEKNASIMREKRIIGCTTTGAAKYFQEVQAASASVLLVEEAGEILESHILTALGPETDQLILIGDHKQLRPKVSNYDLSVEKGEGYDLNRSLFERLVLKEFPHSTLSAQHRMRPEISALVRELTYPELTDSDSTKGRPNLIGFQDNLIFVKHNHPEDRNHRMATEKEMTSLSSKQNTWEAEMTLKCVRYLGQNGYGTNKIVILTPYLGQLQLLKEVLSRENDPWLNDLDSADLVRAGLMTPANAQVTKRRIRISSIDNYQGEESDIVVVTLTRSNSSNDIGFMSSPERLNVLLSRARDALIMIGNPDTFVKSRKGGALWTSFMSLLEGHIYNGFPVVCERHKDTKAFFSKPEDFDEESPNGGCKAPCGTMLSCNLHLCPQSCHQLYDHSKMQCGFVFRDKCLAGHSRSWKCSKPPPPTCQKCEREAAAAEKKRQRDFEIQQKRDEEQRQHQKQMALLDEEIEHERQKIRDDQETRAREIALQQKIKDLEDAATAAVKSRQSLTQSLFSSFPFRRSTPSAPLPPTLTPVNPQQSQSNNQNSSGSQPGTPAAPTATETIKAGVTSNIPLPGPSPSEREWQRQKDFENASNEAIDKIMEMIGLEEVKSQVLRIKAKIDTAIRQNTDFKEERFGVTLLGNPGTGKTTVARRYAKFLNTYHGVLPGTEFVETTGSRLANDGVPGAKKIIEDMLKAGGGTFFLDEAYQLTEKQNHGGPQVLDFLLAEMENNTGKIVFILAGYNKQMEKFFEHNPGLPSRIPYNLQFADYADVELHQMLRKLIIKKYEGKMEVEGGMGGLYMRIVVRRLGRGRGREGYGNMRALENVFAMIKERQADRLTHERSKGRVPNDFYLTKEDLIGPNPSEAIKESEAWKKLQELVGLDTVKESIQGMYDRIETNYRRELMEKPLIQVSLNRVFLGNPGTGKTTVAKLYGQILADLGLLSNGEVVMKNPSDFIGDVLGASEAQTKGILATTVGKVLIIDEAYMLYDSGNGIGKNNDQYKTAVIDTIVAEVQSTPGEDRCVLLLGYEEQIKAMFQNVNPGLERRFALEDAFHFQDFTNAQLRKILELKLKHQGLDATEDAKDVACDLLGRARMRPNFGNAGEVENRISAAKALHQARFSKVPVSQRPIDIIFEPQDFDPKFDRGANAGLNCRKLFEDEVGREELVTQLEGYQQIAINSKAAGLDPHELIPTNFVFKGPPGTGKTTTARKMGQVYYDMGILSSPEVVECSASDLVGQFVGQTGPKTQKQLEKALGKILFVDEAYRLGEGNFATEAVNELVDLVTKPKFLGKIVIILAGYDNDMNKLMTVNPGLSSRFPEEVIFQNMSAESCLQLLDRELKKKKIKAEALQNPDAAPYREMVSLLEQLSALQSWGNGRDVKNLAKTMIGKVYKGKPKAGEAMTLSPEDTVNCFRTLLADRKARDVSIPSTSPGRPFDMTPLLNNLPHAPTQPAPPATNTRRATKKAPPKQKQKPPPPKQQRAPPPQSKSERDPGVSDAIWNKLQADKAAEEQRLKRVQEDLRKRQEEIEARRVHEDAQRKLVEELAAKKAKDDAEMRELMRRREEARLAEQRARIARERALAEMERRRQEEMKRRQLEEQAQQKLRHMGLCVAGFRWNKQADGYRCEGGSHFVSNRQLGM
ncbi:P-loop containing nucleoside triphosphate hydrolase protein [Trichophaea hybrida]|nr:P-loop containing nucleoside triphosphate hydrolase protein [Trichophaea hybrida]